MDFYVSAFNSIVEETKTQQGYELPEDVEVYVVMLLASFVTRADFLPDKSFAQTLLTMKNHRNAKDLGDTCLFVTGVFPTYGNKKGLGVEYYQSIGSSSYSQTAHVLHPTLFNKLSKHFVFISDFINASVNSNNSLHNLFK